MVISPSMSKCFSCLIDLLSMYYIDFHNCRTDELSLLEFSEGNSSGPDPVELNKALESVDIDLSMLERIQDAEEELTVVEVKAPIFRKPLDKLQSKKILKTRIKEDFDAFQQVSIKNGITCAQLAGHFIHRFYYNTNKRLASLGDKLFKGETDIGRLAVVDVLRGLHILSRYSFKNFAHFMKNTFWFIY